ncbi:MAG TPA: hypothetical protein DDZ89_04370, partial [Clostridiales bacterium]|nr:hypothetical protein [Clostridiales bacterium]
MSDILFYLLCGLLSVLVLVGISMMSKVEKAVKGNFLSTIAMAGAILLTLVYYDIISVTSLWIFMAIGLILGVIWGFKIKMIEMPQVVALLNGFGGIASALAATVIMIEPEQQNQDQLMFILVTASLALVVGVVTFTGSMIAAGKLQKVISQKPVIWKNHQWITGISLVLSILSIVMVAIDTKFLPISIIIGW